MYSYLLLRHSRHLSTAVTATATAAATASGHISISKARSMLKTEFDPDKAMEIYSTVSNHYSSPVSARYAQDITVSRLAKSHRFSDIKKFIESHKSDPKITQEPFLSTLIRSYGRAGMFENALKTYEQMDEIGTPRSSISFNSLLTACVQSKLFDRVPQLFEEIPKKYNIEPDKFSYGILVKSYCEKGSPHLAIDRLKEMEDKGIEVTTVTYTTIMNSLYEKGEIDEADRMWREMIMKGCSPDVGAYNTRLKHIHGGDPENVKALIEKMSDEGLKPDTISHNYLMTCYCRNGKMDEAMKVYEGLKEMSCKPNSGTFRTLVYHLCRHGRFETGYEVFKQSVAFNKIPDFNTLQHLVEGLAKKGRKKDAKGLIRTVKKKFPPNFLNAWKRVEERLGFGTATQEDTNV